MAAVTVSGIFIYPVKSLRGVAVADARLEHGRLAGDRTWLIIDAAGRFMHMRDHPQMARVAAHIAPDGLTLATDGMPALEIPGPAAPRATSGRDVTFVRLWRRSVPVTPTTPEADAWLTSALGVPCRLMAFVPDVPAQHTPSYEVHSSLQDATPFHLTTEESLADLNARLSVPIPMERFRPNLVVRGATPYAEDGWRRLAIGDTTLRWIKPCTRCVATTTDHETGARATREPLFTLARYRRFGPEVVFGHYLLADTWGPIMRVGDPVEVLY